MEPLTVFYEDRPAVMASLTLAGFRTQSNQKTKIRLIRVAGRLTDESWQLSTRRVEGILRPASALLIFQPSLSLRCPVGLSGN